MLLRFQQCKLWLFSDLDTLLGHFYWFIVLWLLSTKCQALGKISNCSSCIPNMPQAFVSWLLWISYYLLVYCEIWTFLHQVTWSARQCIIGTTRQHTATGQVQVTDSNIRCHGDGKLCTFSTTTCGVPSWSIPIITTGWRHMFTYTEHGNSGFTLSST